jgi:hypothetical protein
VECERGRGRGTGTGECRVGVKARVVGAALKPDSTARHCGGDATGAAGGDPSRAARTRVSGCQSG